MTECFLGIDTSNYTTSCALYFPDSNSFIKNEQLLAVEHGNRGLRQSDAVFLHTKNLPELLEKTICDAREKFDGIKIISVSSSSCPRNEPDSYMPCFLVGDGVKKEISSVLNIPGYSFSHQQGHIASALFSSGKTELFDKKFLSFHVSGGTTDLLLVSPDADNILNIELIAASLDLKAGQAVDRTGVMLGMDFPSGKFVEEYALKSDIKYKINPFEKDGSVSFSGLENKVRQMMKNGDSKEHICRYCLDYIFFAIKKMCVFGRKIYPDYSIVFAGGVMSNKIIRKNIESEFNNVYFAEPSFSKDNAAGISYLGYLKFKNQIK